MKNKIIIFVAFTIFIYSIGLHASKANADTVLFNDIKGHWAKASIEQAALLGLVKGYPSGAFQPNKTVTRGEFAAFLSRATSQTVSEQVEIPFSDAKAHWSTLDIQKDISLGFIQAADYPNGFSPDTPITRGEISKWMANGLSSKSEDYKQALVDMKDTYLPVKEMIKNTMAAKDIPTVGLMLGTGLLNGFPDLSFGLEKNTTRAEVATILLRYIDVENKKADDFLGLREMREVGTTGTNVTTITPLKYYTESSTGKLLTFKSIMNKPKTFSNKSGTVTVNKLIVVDVRTVNDYTSIYGKMFISNDFYEMENVYYFFTLMTITSFNSSFSEMNLYNSMGNKLQGQVGGLDKSAAQRNGLTTYDYSPSFFQKGIPKQLWNCFLDIKDSVNIHASVDDGSKVMIGSVTFAN